MLRRSFIVLFFVLSGIFTVPEVPAQAAASPAVDPAILAPIDDLIRAANAGSVSGTRSAYVAEPTIVDDFTPFSWSGPNAVVQWTRGLSAVIKQYGITGWRFARHAPRYTHVAANRAWIVVPSDFTFKLKGRPQKVGSAWTFVLSKAGAGWRIETSTWSTTSSSME